MDPTMHHGSLGMPDPGLCTTTSITRYRITTEYASLHQLPDRKVCTGALEAPKRAKRLIWVSFAKCLTLSAYPKPFRPLIVCMCAYASDHAHDFPRVPLVQRGSVHRRQAELSCIRSGNLICAFCRAPGDECLFVLGQYSLAGCSHEYV
eukprot:1158790-Pelagomonas_calceolata.AAC.11